MKSKDTQLLEEAYRAIHEKKTAEELRAEIKQMEQNRDEDEEKSFYYNTTVNKLRKQLKELETESKVLKENEAPMSLSTSGKSVYVVVDSTPYEFDIHGIYSSRELAERALEEFAREQGDSSRYEVAEVSLDQKPTYNYINS